MRITAVRAIPLTATFENYFGGMENVPTEYLHPASHFAAIPRMGQSSTLVEITCDNDIIGYGEAWGLPDAIGPARFVSKMFAPALIGRNPLDILPIWSMLTSAASSLGHSSGHAGAAIAGIDMALWDVKAKYYGAPLSELLGGKFQNSIYCYGSPIMLFDNPRETVAKAKELVDFGFLSIKLKCGRGIRADMEHLQAVCEALPEVEVLIDNNCGYEGKISQAIEFAREAEKLGVGWFEEPLNPSNYDGYRKIRSKINIPIAMGENYHSVDEFAILLRSDAADVLMPNIGRTGITGMTQIHTLAETNSASVSPHGVGSALIIFATLHTMSTWKGATHFEYNRFLNPLREEISMKKLQFNNSRLSVPIGPGIGVELNERCIAKYTENVTW